MTSILTALYNGDLFPPIQYVPTSQEYLKLRQKLSEHYDDFYKTLQNINPDLAKQFAGIMEEQLDVSVFDDKETYMGSFCLGARLMIEIFQHNPKGNGP